MKPYLCWLLGTALAFFAGSVLEESWICAGAFFVAVGVVVVWIFRRFKPEDLKKLKRSKEIQDKKEQQVRRIFLCIALGIIALKGILSLFTLYEKSGY